MQEIFDYLINYGYIILFLYSLGGGMVGIVAAGVLSYNGKMDLTLSIIIASIANAIGDVMLFWLSRYNKAMIMPYLKKHKRKMAYSNILMKKYGDIVIFIQKYIYGVKTLIPIAIGLTKYSFTKFNILNIFASIIWAVVLGLISFESGEFITKVGNYFSSHGWIAPLIMICLLLGIYKFLEYKTKKSKY